MPRPLIVPCVGVMTMKDDPFPSHEPCNAFQWTATGHQFTAFIELLWHTCDRIGWKSWKLIAQTISPVPMLFVAKRRSTYSQGNVEKFWGD